MKYQREIDRLEKEIKNMKKQILLRQERNLSGKKQRKIQVCSFHGFQRSFSIDLFVQKSLIDMYSEVLDELNDYDITYNIQDHLPRVNLCSGEDGQSKKNQG